MKIMASGPITSWQIDGETVETVADFICGGSKITADGDCSHEIKRCLLLGRKVMINLDSIFKSTPMVDSCQCMTKPIQYCKVKYSKNKNLIKEKNEYKHIISNMSRIYLTLKESKLQKQITNCDC